MNAEELDALMGLLFIAPAATPGWVTGTAAMAMADGWEQWRATGPLAAVASNVVPAASFDELLRRCRDLPRVPLWRLAPHKEWERFSAGGEVITYISRGLALILDGLTVVRLVDQELPLSNCPVGGIDGNGELVAVVMPFDDIQELS